MNGGPFALQSLNVRALDSTVSAPPLTFTGTRFNGDTVTQIFGINRPGPVAFVTLNFGPEFTNLVSVTWDPGDVVYDDIVTRSVDFNMGIDFPSFSLDQNIGRTFVEDGIRLTSETAMFTTLDDGSFGFGLTVKLFPSFTSDIFVELEGGGVFDFDSISLNEGGLLFSSRSEVDFEGFKEDGARVRDTFRTDGDLSVWETASFGALFNDLTRLRITLDSPTFSFQSGTVFDNIAIRPANPVITVVTISDPTDPPLSATGLSGLESIALSPDGNRIYGVNPDQDALVVVNADDLTQRQLLKDGFDGVDGLTNVREIVKNPNGAEVYTLAQDDAGNGQIGVFRIDPSNGTLSLIETETRAGELTSLVVSPGGSQVFAAFGDDIVRFNRTASGALSLSGSLGGVPAGSRNTAIAIDGTGSRLVAADDTGDRLLILNPTTGGLLGQVGGIDGATDIALGPDNQFAYVTSGTQNSVHVVDLNAGAIVQTLRDGARGVRGIRGASSVAFSPDNEFVYVTGRESDGLAVFKQDASDGALKFVQLFLNNNSGALGLETPTEIAVAGDGTVFIGSAEGRGVGGTGGIATFAPLSSGFVEPDGFTVTFEDVQELTVRTTGGNDFIDLIGPPTFNGSTGLMTTNIDTGGGADFVNLLRLGGTTNVKTGAGEDVLEIRSGTSNTTLTADTGSDEDAINLRRTGPGSSVTVSGGLGDDLFTVDGSNLDSSSTILNPTVQLNGDDPAAPADPGDRLRFVAVGDGISPESALIPGADDVTPPEGLLGALDDSIPPQRLGVLKYFTMEGVEVIAAPDAEINGPFTIDEGDGLVLSSMGTRSFGRTVDLEWDINGDGLFGEVSIEGVIVDENDDFSVTLSWDELRAFGIDDDGTFDIALRVTNDLDLSTDDFSTITVNNTPPTLTINGPAQVNEGSVYSLSLDSFDPGDDTISEWKIEWGDGAVEFFASDATEVTHVYEDDTPGGVRTITATATDEDGAFSTSTDVEVLNVAPTLNLDGDDTVDEGSPYLLDLSATDPGADTVSEWEVDWGDGTLETFIGPIQSLTHAYADDGSRTISVTATDEDGEFTATKDITVENVLPTLTIAGQPDPVDERDTYTLSLASSDPGDDTISEWAIDWGDGTVETFAGDPTEVTHVYADDSAGSPLTITATAIDEDGDFTTSTGVNVLNVAPTLNLAGDDTVDEGSPYQLDLSATDPGEDTVSQWIVNWGDGTLETFEGPAQSLAHTYADDGAQTIFVTAIDEDGLFSASKDIAVTNVAPALAIAGRPEPADEGDTYTLSLASSDPGDDAISEWTIDWGDATSDTVSGDVTSLTHDYADDSAGRPGGVYGITATANDEDGGFSTSTDATVLDVAPEFVFSDLDLVEEGSLITLTVAAIDPGDDTVSEWVIDWGDGASDTVPGSAAPDNTVTLTHTYDDDSANESNGAYRITATATNEDSVFEGTTDAAVLNVAPRIELTGAPSVDEGSVYTLNVGDVFDPGDDTIIGGLTIDWGDGTVVETFDPIPQSLTHTYTDDLLANVAVTLTDEDGIHTISTLTLVDEGDPGTAADDVLTESNVIPVLNVAPTLTLDGADTVEEGSPYLLDLSAADPGDDTVSQWIVDWGDGKVETFDGPTQSLDHTYADDADRTIAVTAIDDDGVYNATKDVAITDVAPTLTIDGPDVINEGDEYTLSLAASDPGDDTVTEWTIYWGDGTSDTVAGDVTSLTHDYADDSAGRLGGVYNITATAVQDNDPSAAFTASTDVTVVNVAPTLNLAGDDTVDEGSVYTLDLSATDPGDDTVSQWIVNWDDGTVETFDGATQSLTHIYADDGARTISVTASDEDGEFDAAKDVTVANVAPTLTIGGLEEINEGDEYTLSLATFDPGNDTVTVTIDWGDGTSNTVPGDTDTVIHTYVDDSKDQSDGTFTFTIAATASDEDGGFTLAELDVTVNDVDPTLSLVGADTVDESSPYELDLSSTDPGKDTMAQWIVDWGDGTLETFDGPTQSLTHTYVDDSADQPGGVRSIKVTGVDEDGGVTVGKDVEVLNVSPTIGLIGEDTAIDKIPYTLSFGDIVDPGDDTVTQIIVDWGDGSPVETFAGDVTSATHVYIVNEPIGPNGEIPEIPRTISVDLVDEDGAHEDAGVKTIIATIQPFLASLQDDGSLLLHIGENAEKRVGGDITDGDETFSLRHISGTAGNEVVEITFGPFVQLYGPGEFEGAFDLIVGFAGLGNDAILLDDVLTSAELEGGVGRDTLIGGQGDDTLRGNSGDDLLGGGGGNDLVLGGAGDDTLRGGSGDDVMVGDFDLGLAPFLGRLPDLESGLFDAGGDLEGLGSRIEGLEDSLDDLLTALGDAGLQDGLSLVGGNDVLEGEGDNDTMVGDSITFIGSSLSGFNLIGGNDTMLGGGGDDEMVGDNVAIIAPGADISTQEVFDETVIAHKGHFHDTGLFHERTQQGHFDVVSGLSIIGGNDEMDGGAGNDVMRGDNNVILAPSVTITSSVTYADAGVVVDAEVIDPGDPHDIISELNIVGGDDVMDGGLDDDVVIGDNSVLIAPVVSVTQDVVHEDEDSGKKHKKHRSKDPHLNHDVHNDLVDDLVDGITITGGNDVIGGGDDNDVLVGDNSVLVTPFVEWTRDEVFEDDGLKDRHHHGKGHHKGHHGGHHPHGVAVDGQDLIGALDIIGGNDLMDGGDGADMLVGDNSTIVAPFVTLSVNEMHNHNTDGKGKKHHHHDDEDHEAGFGHESPDDVVGALNLTGGNDTMSGGLGDDTMFGDNATVVAPFLELTLNTEHDDDHHKGKHGRHGHGKHHGHHGHHNGPHSVLGDLTVVGGNDILDGGSGNDLMTGDNSTLIAPMVNSTLNVTHAEDHDHGKHKHHKHHGHDDHGAFQGSVVNGLSVMGGNDTLTGGDDDDLITGDNATVIAPDIVLNLNGTHPDDGKHHGKHHDDHNDHDGGLFGNVVGSAHVTGGDDTVLGGDGDDFIVGDNATVIGSSLSVFIDGVPEERRHAEHGSRHHKHHHGDHGVSLHNVLGSFHVTGGNDDLAGGTGDDFVVGDNLTLQVLNGGHHDGRGHHGKHHGHGGHHDGHGFFHDDGGNDTISGGDGADIVAGDSIDVEVITDHDDHHDDKHHKKHHKHHHGRHGKDHHTHHGGDDVIDGDGDADILFGQDGHDTIAGGDGNDSIFGGKDKDDLDGGLGEDRVKKGDGPLDKHDHKDEKGKDGLIADAVEAGVGEWFGNILNSSGPWVPNFLLDLATPDGALDPNASIAVVIPEGDGHHHHGHDDDHGHHGHGGHHHDHDDHDDDDDDHGHHHHGGHQHGHGHGHHDDDHKDKDDDKGKKKK